MGAGGRGRRNQRQRPRALRHMGSPRGPEFTHLPLPSPISSLPLPPLSPCLSDGPPPGHLSGSTRTSFSGCARPRRRAMGGPRKRPD
eukprot:2873863-Pyramimonas_sp.AAC.1